MSMGMGVKKGLRPSSHGNEQANPNEHLYHGITTLGGVGNCKQEEFQWCKME